MIGVILAGGASRRFGGAPKGLISVGSKSLARRAADLLETFCARVFVEAAAGTGYDEIGLPLCTALPEHAGKGPLAGLAAGLALAAGDERVAFAPCDMPLLTFQVYEALAGACDQAPGAYANTEAGEEPLVAVLTGGMRPALLQTLALDNVPRTCVALDAAGARMVPFAEADVFENINTPEDLKRIQAKFATR